MRYIPTRLALVYLLSSWLPVPAMEVPLELQHDNWQQLEYDNIPANRVTQLEHGIAIHVESSASPLIYLFDRPVELSKLKVTGQMGALPVIPEGLVQGDRHADDFPLRVGLVLEGDKTLNFAQRLIASQWIRTLFELAPGDTGIDRIHFLNLANPGQPGWGRREHPDGRGLYTETIVKQVEAGQPYDLEFEASESTRVLALWISADGDDTGSVYSLSIESIYYE